jgi:ubiquinone/menaquinone biosynthesis C-methylase UbiE
MCKCLSVNVYPGFFVIEKYREGNENLIRQLVRQGLNEMLRVTKKGGEIRIAPISKIIDNEKIKKYKELNELTKWGEIIKEEIENYCKELQLELEIQFLKEAKFPIFVSQDDKPVETEDYYFQKDYLMIIKK